MEGLFLFEINLILKSLLFPMSSLCLKTSCDTSPLTVLPEPAPRALAASPSSSIDPGTPFAVLQPVLNPVIQFTESQVFVTDPSFNRVERRGVLDKTQYFRVSRGFGSRVV